jgi:hypothetical protein
VKFALTDLVGFAWSVKFALTDLVGFAWSVNIYILFDNKSNNRQVWSSDSSASGKFGGDPSVHLDHFVKETIPQNFITKWARPGLLVCQQKVQ